MLVIGFTLEAAHRLINGANVKCANCGSTVPEEGTVITDVLHMEDRSCCMRMCTACLKGKHA
jgi:hypothetical protein